METVRNLFFQLKTPVLLTSSEVELMETGADGQRSQLRSKLLTSSEVELMET